ncbi:MAG: hypothetical protein ACTTH5_06910 [Wolinella sp.]
MKGTITAINPLKQEASVKVNSYKTPVAFKLERFEGDKEGLFIGLEVDVLFSPKKEIIKVIPTQNAKCPEKLKYLEINKSIEECVLLYFSDIRSLLMHFKITNKTTPQIDFLRIRRFLFTAYNDLYELDNSVYNPKLDQLRTELKKVQKEYDAFKRKIGYPVKYVYEKVFLRAQSNYTKLEERIELTQGLIRNITIQERPLAERLRDREQRLHRFEDKKSDEYKKLERETKELRRRYVDLLHTLSTQRELLGELFEAQKNFFEQYFQEFVDLYNPLSEELDQRILWVLNTKAYELDSALWGRAKQSKLIRQFFIDSGITGTYSSKTFLKYYLKSLDQEKLRSENRELFSLLSYLESISKKNIFIIKESCESSLRCKYLLENFDKELQVSVIKDPLDVLKITDATRPDIILLDLNITGIGPFEFVQKYRNLFGADGTQVLFCLFVNELTSELFTQAKKVGIKHYLRANSSDDEFIDSMRTIL